MRNIPNQLNRIQDKYNITEEHEKRNPNMVPSFLFFVLYLQNGYL